MASQPRSEPAGNRRSRSLGEDDWVAQVVDAGGRVVAASAAIAEGAATRRGSRWANDPGDRADTGR